MKEISLSENDIERLESGGVVAHEREDGNRVRIADYESEHGAATIDMFIVKESIELLKAGEHVEYPDSGYYLVKDGSDAEPSPEKENSKNMATESHETGVSDDVPDDLTRVDIDTAMLRELATGTVEITISLAGEEWDKLAQGSSVETDDLYLSYDR